MAAPSVKLWNPVGPGHQRFSKGSRYVVDTQSAADSIDSSESHLTTVFWHQAPRSSVLRSDTPTASRLLELPASVIPTPADESDASCARQRAHPIDVTEARNRLTVNY